MPDTDPTQCVRGYQCVRGQYDGYRPGAAAGSATETYIAPRPLVANTRRAGVPFLIRTG